MVTKCEMSKALTIITQSNLYNLTILELFVSFCIKRKHVTRVSRVFVAKLLTTFQNGSRKTVY
jgi:hypothetical protein